MSFLGTYGERREAAAAACSHWDQGQELKRKDGAKKGAEATGTFPNSDVILGQAPGALAGLSQIMSPQASVII